MCAYGSTLVLVTFDGNRLHTQPVVVREPLHLVIVDLHKGKNTKRILKDLNACYPLPTVCIRSVRSKTLRAYACRRPFTLACTACWVRSTDA